MIYRSADVPEPAANAVWRWECVKGQCEKILITEGTMETALSLGACKMFCNDFGNKYFYLISHCDFFPFFLNVFCAIGNMWPRPTSKFEIGNNLIHLNKNSVDVLMQNSEGAAADLMRSAIRVI